MVEYLNPADAQMAIETFDNTRFDGRIINVREDRELQGGNRNFNNPPPRRNWNNNNNYNNNGPPRFNNNNNNNNQQFYGPPIGKKLFIGNLPYETNWRTLKDIFSRSGYVLRADVYTHENGRGKGTGYVIYDNEDDAFAAIEELNGTTIGGRTIFVREDRYE
eukprot:TRINITY_DN84_c0_g1_i1.p1 TRINITY_DN84_c0_g1~~TRINITY_DN84_c0_g1_i1.p1  ORF type:complete len:162 (-),score=45.94 TRINITY_DN84_c0_g1_i1:463-948(-)